ncbi:MAG: 3-oxoacyl-ACP reductase FabG [Prevotella sp.]|nr:3-oxoacyl-ACP reductase FabG [Prevotella sp.]
MTTNKRYALVTGGSRGIGRAVSVRLARMGYDILINYVSNAAEAKKTLDLVRAEGRDGDVLMFDVSRREQVTKAIEAWEASHPDEYIEVLVNNAGIRRDNILAFMPEEDWNVVVNTTLSGFYNVTGAVLQPMLIRKQGRIINIASVSGLKGLPGQTNYSAAKGGLIAATKALALEVARKRVTVNAVAPGFIETDMTDGLDKTTLVKAIPLSRFGKPEEVAELVAFLASPEAAYITGEVISINGGLYT